MCSRSLPFAHALSLSTFHVCAFALYFSLMHSRSLPFRHVLDIKTSQVGLNFGRCFTLMADTKEDLEHLKDSLCETRQGALRTQRSNSSLYLNSVIIGRQFSKSIFFHRLQAVVIAISFLLCLVEVRQAPL